MGVRKRQAATLIKDKRKNLGFAKLNNCPSSPRKMRLVADLIRGKNISQNYFIFCCHPGNFGGGFGDRMVGFTSVVLLTKILKKRE